MFVFDFYLQCSKLKISTFSTEIRQNIEAISGCVKGLRGNLNFWKLRKIKKVYLLLNIFRPNRVHWRISDFLRET